MTRFLAGAVIASFLCGLAWRHGNAQSLQAFQPDFDLLVFAADDDIKVKCVRGCTLASRPESGAADPKMGRDTFGLRCAADVCEVRVIGWLQK
jgi:hypothetical protein